MLATFSTLSSWPKATCVTGTVCLAQHDRRPAAFETAGVEIEIDDRRQIALGFDDSFRFQTGERHVVLMHTLHGDPVRSRPGRLGECHSPLHMGIVQQPGPVDRTDDDRLPCPQQDEPHRFQRIINPDNRFDPTAAQRVPHRRRDFIPKPGERQIPRLLRSRRTQQSCGPQSSPQ